MKKDNLLVSFSGGRTSAFMAKWLWDNCQDYFNMVFVFANTGLEHYNTIDFVVKCSHRFGFKVHFIEADVNPIKGIGTGYKEYDCHTKLSEPYKFHPDHRIIPFEQMVQKYGLPNTAFKHCSRELKTVPIRKFGQDFFGGNDFYQAIGIRYDEIDRQSVKKEELKILYPLIALEITHKHINEFWEEMPFKLELEGYNGNCVMCWKKDFRKLALVLKEDFHHAKYFHNLEQKYAYHYTNAPILDEWGDPVPIRMYRQHKTIYEISQIQVTKEEVLAINAEREEACEAHAECGIDN